MKVKDIVVGGVYVAKVNGKLTKVRLDAIRETNSYRAHQPHTAVKRYDVTNLATGRTTMFRSAAKFRYAYQPKAANDTLVDRGFTDAELARLDNL